MNSNSPGRGGPVTLEHRTQRRAPLSPTAGLASSTVAGNRYAARDGYAIGSRRDLLAAPFYSDTSPHPSARSGDSDVVGRELRMGGGKRQFAHSRNLYTQGFAAVGEGASIDTASARQLTPTPRETPRPTSARTARR